MCESRLLLNDMPEFLENLLEIRRCRVISVVTNSKIYSAFSVLFTKGLCSVGELNFS